MCIFSAFHYCAVGKKPICDNDKSVQIYFKLG